MDVGTDTAFNNSIPVHSNDVPISNTPEIPAEEPIDLHLLSLPNQNPQATDHDIPVQEGYSWIPEHEINTSKEIIGNVGDPKNILNHSRQPKHHANLADHLSLDPKTYFQALNSPDGEEWLKAINLELKNMVNHQILSPTIKSDHIKPLSTTWVFKRKTDENRNVSKFKAHLCVRRFHQKAGVDYTKVFSETGQISSFRLLLTFCHINHFPIEQMDVRCAFLNGTPKEVLHILCPSAYTEHPKTDISLFLLLSKRNQPLWLFVHVNDLIFGGTWNSLFKEKIQLFFEMEDLGKIEFSIEQAKAPPSPLPSNYKELKTLTLEPPKQPPFNFQHAVGLLQYLVQCTRPNLCFATSFLSQFLESPAWSKSHQSPEKQNCGLYQLRLGGGTEKKSFSGSLIYFHGALGWRAHKQKVVALSSTEAEYNAMTESTQDLAWMKQVIQEAIGVTCMCTLHSDNQSAISIASNPIYHHGT
ncbi:hypothetical protein O181_027273 [Austropuccinia psidii MF-1]|uniref:Reverse transcriptase Ty1/copia-type domain-containing protein n=1 Tax=Austropuccinia psidii MF-1 TaxID=1389203 RepID=A0A9Q3CRI0_9BASI|nr:hypothetical protein [Austropuccinia psidii MF-1]